MILTVTFMLVTGLPALGPPRLAMLQMTRLVLINPGTGGLHVAWFAPVLGVAETEVIFSTLSIFRVSRRLFA